MRCKPGQLATIVRAAFAQPCTRSCVGVPVRVVALDAPSYFDFDGPAWLLENPVHCPSKTAGCRGIVSMPDACLLPFDPASEPEAEPVDTAAPALPDYLTGQGA